MKPVDCLLVSSGDIEFATRIHLSTDTVEDNRRRLKLWYVPHCKPRLFWDDGDGSACVNFKPKAIAPNV